MLHRLTVKNFALLRDAELTLGHGFTAVTGETGAGKSLLIGAVSFLAGGKAAPGVVRDNARTAVVEGTFQTGTDRTFTIRRELSSLGRARAFIDDSPVTLKALSAVTSALVDITSQRAFSHLLESSHHLDLLDTFAGLRELRQNLQDFHREHVSLSRKIATLIRKRAAFRERRELLAFQLAAIDRLDAREGEDAEIAAEVKRLEHFEELHSAGELVRELLTDGGESALTRLVDARRLIDRLAELDPRLSALSSDLESARIAVSEAASQVEERCLRTHYEVERLDQLRERLHQLTGIARKFGGSLAAALSHASRLRAEIDESDFDAEEQHALTARMEKLTAEWCALAKSAGDARRKGAAKLEKSVISSLSRLGVKDGLLKVQFAMTPDPNGEFQHQGGRFKLHDYGAEAAEFYLSANPGLEPRPLAQVASGGELSRLLLALKEALPPQSDEATVFLDEIDAGVSGRIASLVGQKLKQLAAGRQILVITHLPQIAALADRQLRVTKSKGRDGMETEVIEITGEQRTHEIAAMLSGGAVTDAAVKQARNLIAAGKEEP